MNQAKKASDLLQKRLNKILNFNYGNNAITNREIISDHEFKKLKILDDNSKTLLYAFNTEYINRLIIDLVLKTLKQSRKVLFFHIQEIDPYLDHILHSLFKSELFDTLDSLDFLDRYNLHFYNIWNKQDEKSFLKAIDQLKPDLIIMDDINFLLPRRSPNLIFQNIINTCNCPIIMTVRLGNLGSPCDFLINQFTANQITRLAENDIVGHALIPTSYADNILFYEHHSAFKGTHNLKERSEYIHVLRSRIFDNKKLKLKWQDRLSSYSNSFS